MVPRILGQPDRVLEIVGHTDNTGSTAHNQRLSEQRAQAVADYLIERSVTPEQLETSGRGENEPIASNDTHDGQAANRRVQLRLR